MNVLSILYGMIVLGLAIRPWKFIVNPVTVFLGTISYSLYLAHPVVISFLFPIYERIYTLPLRSTFSYALCALLTLLIVILLAYITYRLIEKPGMRLGSQLITRLKNYKSPRPAWKPENAE